MGKTDSIFYVAFILLRNAFYNKNGNITKGDVGCLKAGKCDRDSLTRLGEHKSDYDAYGSILLLEFKVKNATQTEKDFKEFMKQYKISIYCSQLAKIHQPQEFYTVNDDTINTINQFINIFKLTSEDPNNVFDDDEDSLCEFMFDEYDLLNLNNNELTIINSHKDSLLSEQSQILTQNNYEDACKKIKLYNQSIVVG
jgi:hypothetical protein